MPEIIVNLTAAEYGASLKRKARKQITQAIASIIIGVALFAVLVWVLWGAVHIP